MKRVWAWLGASLLGCGLWGCGGEVPARVNIGSKKFTESVILGELAVGLARSSDSALVPVHHRELGGTRILWDGLASGQIDVYPEYTGTLRAEILSSESIPDDATLKAALARHGVRMGAPLGFNNTYAIGMKRAQATRLGIRRISDLLKHPGLRFGFTSEFMSRADGWPGLRARYALAPRDVRGLDHDLAYRGLEAGTLDVTDLYSTDADIAYYDLAVLQDDRAFFPEYQAVFLYREAFAQAHPRLVQRMESLAGQIDEQSMRALNAAVKLERKSEASVSRQFLSSRFGVHTEAAEESRAAALLEHTLAHLFLVCVSLLAAIALAVPLGIWAARQRRAGQLILALVGVLQTIPSLALLVFMIPLLGIGAPPAMMALFLYSLLPIVRNTHEGLTSIPGATRESALALGLPPRARLLQVELPLASPSILAGIKPSAVINVGTATLGALIGAGGYGQPILTGIRLNDQALILQGAVPAALLALAVQGGFDLLERMVVPRGLRL